MNKKKKYLFLMLALLYLVGCGKEKGRGDVYLLLQNVEKVYVYDPNEDSLYTDVLTTGTTPNYLLFSDGQGYIVNSGFGGTPSIQIFNTEDNEIITTHPLPQNSNPWAVALVDKDMYVTSWTFNKVYILNENGNITDSLKVGQSPEGIISDGNKIYVACANVSYDTTGYPIYGDAYLYLIEGKSVKDSIKVGKNAQAVQKNGDEIIVLSTGDYGITQNGRLYIIQNNTLKDSIEIDGDPGYFVVKEDKAYIVGYSDSLKIVDLTNKEIKKLKLDTQGFMACDQDGTGKIFVVQGDWVAENNNLIIIENDAVVKTISLGNATGTSFVRVKE